MRRGYSISLEVWADKGYTIETLRTTTFWNQVVAAGLAAMAGRTPQGRLIVQQAVGMRFTPPAIDEHPAPTEGSEEVSGEVVDVSDGDGGE